MSSGDCSLYSLTKLIRTMLGVVGRPRVTARPAADDDYWYTPRSIPTASGVGIDSDSALRVAAVFACVRVLAETIASLPLHVYRRLPGGGKARAPEHKLYHLLHDQPNEWQTSFEFREQLMGHLCLRGNAYAEIVPGVRGTVNELLPIHPDRVSVYRLINKRLQYEVRDPFTNRKRILSQDMVLHLRGLSSDGMLGLNPIEMQRDVIGNARATDIQAGAFFKQGMRPSGVLQHPGKLSDEAQKHLRDSMMDVHGGAENAHKMMILEEGMEWRSLSMTSEDAQFIENRKYNVTDIARIFRLPPYMVGDYERATYSNVEQAAIDFVVHTIRPWLVRWEQAFTRDLITDSDTYFAEFLVEGLLRGDIQARSAALQTQFQNGAITIDEWREIENRNPVPDGLGQQHYVPLNMKPVGEEPRTVVPVTPATNPKDGEG